MSFIPRLKNNVITILKSTSLYSAIVLSSLTSWGLKNGITSLLFKGKSFGDHGLVTQFGLLVVYTTIFIVLFLAVFSLLSKFFPNTLRKIEQVLDHWAEKVLQDVKKRIFIALLVLSIGFGVVILVNEVLARINITERRYEVPQEIPLMLPVGWDFRIGSYQPALNLVQSNFTQISPDGTYYSIYPPFVSFINILYLLFDENTAYLWHLGFLFFAHIACIVMAAWMAKEFIFSNLGLEKIYIDMLALFLFFAILIYTFSSYSFMFVIERGQTDIFALLFSMLAILCLIKRPDNIWLQVILLSIATHLKIYPIVLFFVLLRKHGRKLILPALIVNLAMLFILGPKMAYDFLLSLTSSGSGLGGGVGNRWTWIGNHSAYSFADYMARISSNYRLMLYILWPICTLIPFELWFIATYTLLKKYTALNAVLYFMVSISLMDLFPTISMDYRLVILSPAALLLIGLILKRIILCPRWFDYFQLVLVVLLLLLIGRAYPMSETFDYGLKESASFFINNKYLWSLALQAIMVWNIFNIRKMIHIEPGISST